MPSQSLITKPSKPMLSLSTPAISSWLACILIGLPTPSSVQSTLEYDGITAADVVVAARPATYWRQGVVRRSPARLVIAMPWSIV